MCELTVDALPFEERRQWVRDLIVKEAERQNIGESSTKACIQYADDLLKDNYSAARSLQLAKDLVAELGRLHVVNVVFDRLVGPVAPR